MIDHARTAEEAPPTHATEPGAAAEGIARARDAACAICGSARGQTHRVREMMFGLGEPFTYFECAGCGCLQLLDPPGDMGRFYPPDVYYSFQVEPAPVAPREDPGPLLQRPIRALRHWSSMKQREAVLFKSGGIFERLGRRHQMEGWCDLFRRYVEDSPRRSLRARILDVGCGSGHLLAQLACYGFSRLEGVDPYIPETIITPGYRVRKADVRSLGGESYDLILMNHSLEHIEDQAGTLAAILALLSRRGVCRVEVPVAECEAWSYYGPDWVELDAPRHYFLHTTRSLARLAGAVGLEVYRTEDVGTPLEFWGSEFYRRGLALFDAGEKTYRDPRRVFSEEEMGEFERRSAEASRGHRGGRLAFYLRRPQRSRGGRPGVKPS